jgi:hypothetical protein
MTNSLIPTSALTEIDEEPRIQDTELAKRLEFKRSYDIRELINRNKSELENYGPLPVRHGQSRGQAFKAFYLNEGQALVICALSRTEKAAEIRKLIIDVFMAWRRGKTVDVKEHYRRPPAPKAADDQQRFQMKQFAPGGLVTIEAVVPFDLARDYVVMFSNYRRVTF